MRFGQHEFDGPYGLADTRIPHGESGLYAVVDEVPGGSCRLLDIGESGDVEVSLANRERMECWKEHAKGGIRVYILITPRDLYSDEWRRKVEKDLRLKFDPPCAII
jgi:hypothetical protein